MDDRVAIGYMMLANAHDHRVDEAALTAAQSKPGPALGKLETYMACHKDAPQLLSAWRRAAKMRRLFLLVMIGVAAVAGGLAGVSAFGTSTSPAGIADQVNVFWLLGALLGIHFINLAIWLFFIWRAPTGGFSITSAVSAASHWALRDEPSLHLAAQGYGDTHLKGRLGRWTMSCVSHGFWAIYLTAGMIACVILLSIQSYVFVWETTLLSGNTAAAIVGVLGAPMRALGLFVPSESAVAAAQAVNQGAIASQDARGWAQFCLASLGLYGVLPRALLSGLSVVQRRRYERALKLDASDPFFAGLLAQIYQPPVATDIIDADTVGAQRTPRQDPAISNAHRMMEGAIIGWEVDTGTLQNAPDTTILGVFERADALAAALDAHGPAPITLVVSLLNTPDRGVAASLAPFKALPQDCKKAWLADADTLRLRSGQGDAQRRIGDWWSLLTQLGFDAASIRNDSKGSA